MGRIPKDKETLTLYVSPECKEKLRCLQNLYLLANKKLSISAIIEDMVGFLYNIAYICQNNIFWKSFIKLYQLLSVDSGLNSEISQLLKIIKDKSFDVKDVLTIPVDMKQRAKDVLKEELLGIKKEKN
jgi:hypothetical protein